QTNILQHNIRTPPGIIIQQRPYHVPEAHRQAIEEEVQQLLKLGVIEPSRNPWSSPIVMVPKPDGTLHFCSEVSSGLRKKKVEAVRTVPRPKTKTQ
ncbi:hypothetical protein M9458_029474, partial [Cirrhinus mrigala]